MAEKRRQYTEYFKRGLVCEVEARRARGEKGAQSAVAREYNLDPSLLSTWRKQLGPYGGLVKPAADEQQLAGRLSTVEARQDVAAKHLARQFDQGLALERRIAQLERCLGTAPVYPPGALDVFTTWLENTAKGRA